MVWWLFSSELDRRRRRANGLMRDTSVDEADVLYAGAWNNKTRANTVLELSGRGLSVTDLQPDDIEERNGELEVNGVPVSELEDTVVFYRQASFKSDLSEDKVPENVLQMQRLEEEYGVEFVNSPQGAALCSDKEITKRALKNLENVGRQELVEFAQEEYEPGEELDEEWMEFLEEYWDEEEEKLDNDFMDIEIPETYRDYERAEGEMEEDDIVVKKPFEGSHGEGIEFLEFGEIDEFEDGFLYEEFVDHYSESEVYEDIVDSRIWVAGDEHEAVDREIDSGEPEPTNINNGGEYSEEPMDSGIEERLVSYLVGEELDMDVFAIDCVRKVDEDGKKTIVPYEVNSTPGTKLNDYDVCDQDLYEMTADTIEDALEDTGIQDEPEMQVEAGVGNYAPAVG